jgi:hypothetical protein
VGKIGQKRTAKNGVTFKEINRAASNHKLGTRGTPVISFWPMRDKWKKYGDYWELWGQDGDLTISKNDDGEIGGLMAPAEYRLIYFVVPGTEMVCQVAYEVNPKQLETAESALRRHNRVAENLRQGLSKVQRTLAG